MNFSKSNNQKQNSCHAIVERNKQKKANPDNTLLNYRQMIVKVTIVDSGSTECGAKFALRDTVQLIDSVVPFVVGGAICDPYPFQLRALTRCRPHDPRSAD